MTDRIWISRTLFLQMCQFGEQKFPLETGGMLLGYTSDTGDVVVTEIIGPGPNAIHRRYRFLPDADYQQERLEAHHLRTNGIESYLGDWHTHPHGDPIPSRLDRKTLAKIASSPSSGITNPVMAIVGGGTGEWKPNAFRFIGCGRCFLFKSYDLAELSPMLYGESG